MSLRFSNQLVAELYPPSRTAWQAGEVLAGRSGAQGGEDPCVVEGCVASLVACSSATAAMATTTSPAHTPWRLDSVSPKAAPPAASPNTGMCVRNEPATKADI